MNNKDRVQIDGVWYVRETDPVEIDPIYYLGAVFENEAYCFDATVLVEDGEFLRDTFSVKFKNKRTQIEEFWDNNNFFDGLLNDDAISWASFEDSVVVGHRAFFMEFLRELKSKEWF